MTNNHSPEHVDQTFRDDERLFRRVHRTNIRATGRPTLLAFELPDMSVNRSRFSSAEEARKGFRPEDWGVVSITVSEMPPREDIPQVAHYYRFRARHVPTKGNFSHSEVRVWRIDGLVAVLVTTRSAEEFAEDDPDRTEPRADSTVLDPDFHMRWRRRLAECCRPELQPLEAEA